jgi:hypothetical protein
MRERANIGEESNRLNYIPKSTGINFPKDWEYIWWRGKTPCAILYAINQGNHDVAFHLHIERSKYDVQKNSRL